MSEHATEITVPRPTVPQGPKGWPTALADANYLRSAASYVEFARCMGSNLTATVTKLLRDAADALERGHEFDEDVNDASMCLCGVAALIHDEVFPPAAPEPRAVGEGMRDELAHELHRVMSCEHVSQETADDLMPWVQHKLDRMKSVAHEAGWDAAMAYMQTAKM